MKRMFAGLALALCCTTANAAEPTPKADLIKGLGISVSNLDRSTKFYTDIIGLKIASIVPPGPAANAKEIVLSMSGKFDLGETTLLVLQHLNDDPLPADRVKFGRLMFIAKDAPAILERAKAAGYTVRPGNPSNFITDPDGYSVTVTVPIALPPTPPPGTR